VTRETEVDQSGIDDGHSMLDKLNGDELTETLTHILARLRLSVSKVNWPSDPGKHSTLDSHLNLDAVSSSLRICGALCKGLLQKVCKTKMSPETHLSC